MNQRKSVRRIERARRWTGWALQEWFERGLEFGVAGATLINGRAAITSNPSGAPFAPYLASALDILSHQPAWWACLMAIIGLVHLVILLVSFGSDRTRWRFAIGAVQTALYIAVSTAILTGPLPHQPAERYLWTTFLLFWTTVALLAQGVARHKLRREYAE